MNLTRPFEDALREVESGRPFVPFVQGEAARLERCAIAAKRVFDLPDGAAVDPASVAQRLGVRVIGNREQFGVLPEDLRKQMLGSRQWSAGTIAGPHGPLIVLNPRHAATRLKVTLAEELAHLVMGHPPTEIDPSTG